MNINVFLSKFNSKFPADKISKKNFAYQQVVFSVFFDLCPRAKGMISIKKQKLLNIAYSCLGEGECYLEIGTYQGKSLISAMIGNQRRKTYACDNFSEFTLSNSKEMLMRNLYIYKLKKDVTFFDRDFREVLNKDAIAVPVGVYFYDGAHDQKSQYLAVKKVESLLSDEALVIIDDWRLAEDSQSYAKVGTEKAIAESNHKWRMLYELPARYNGDRAMWWNGLAVFSFQRLKV